MRELMRGRERTLSMAGGLAVPGFMVLVLFASPLLGAQAAYLVLKLAATCFTVIAIFWYFADDRVRAEEELADADEDARVDEEAPEEDPEPEVIVFKGELGGNEGLKTRGFPKESILPGDAKMIKGFDGWAIYLSAAENALFLKTTDYHPKPLKLTEETLAELLESIRAESGNH